jgi:hypothetical protein
LIFSLSVDVFSSSRCSPRKTTHIQPTWSWTLTPWSHVFLGLKGEVEQSKCGKLDVTLMIF